MEERAAVRISRHDSSGFTLIEVMMAMLIVMVGLMGLLQAVNVATEHNLRNQLRDEATFLAEQWMGDLKSRGFTQISGVSGTQFSPRLVNSRLRGGKIQYTVQRPCESTGGGTAAKLTVNVIWYYKGSQYSHSVSSLRSQ